MTLPDTCHLTAKDALSELPHLAHDLLLGANPEPKDPNYLYADIHLHLPLGAPMHRVIDTAAQRVDIMSIVDRETSIARSGGYQSYGMAVEALEWERIDHIPGERVTKVLHNGKAFYIVRAIEVYGKERQEIVVLGSDTPFKDADTRPRTIDELIAEAQDLGTLWFLDHPFTVDERYATKEEVKRLERWITRYRPIIETGNHQNTLWMYTSNILARKLAEKYHLVGIANSDSHFRLQEIGLSRTCIPRDMIDETSNDTILTSLQTALSPENKERIKLESGYSSIWAFGQYMIFPFVCRKLGMPDAALRLRGVDPRLLTKE